MQVITFPTPEQIDDEIKAEKCRRSLYEFTKEFWNVIEPGKEFIDGWHVRAMCDHLQAVNEGIFSNLIICIPPGFAKSTIVSVMWFTWTWIDMPHLKFLYGSYDERLTFRDSDKCRDIIRSKKYQRMFNPEWSIKTDTDTKTLFANTYQGNRKTYYMTSRKKTGWRGEYLVVDDPLSAEDRYDKNIKLQVIDTWKSTLWSRINRAGHHARVIIMQRLAEDDLVGFILADPKNTYVKLILQNEFDPKNRCVTPIFSDPRTEEGELLCPALFSQEQTDEAKATSGLGFVDYSAQYQHSPIPLGGNKFRLEFFKHWKQSSSPYLIELNHGNDKISRIRVDRTSQFLSVDFAASEKKSADFTSIGRWAQTDKNELILLHRVLFKGSESEIIDMLKVVYGMQQWGRIPPYAVFAEDNGLGLPIAQNAQEKGLPVVFVHVHKDKEVMAASASIRMRGGQIFFPVYEQATWMHEFTQMITSYPGGAHDDDVSMMSIAANALFEGKEATFRNITTAGESKPRYNPQQKISRDEPARKLFGGNGNSGNGLR